MLPINHHLLFLPVSFTYAFYAADNRGRYGYNVPLQRTVQELWTAKTKIQQTKHFFPSSDTKQNYIQHFKRSSTTEPIWRQINEPQTETIGEKKNHYYIAVTSTQLS